MDGDLKDRGLWRTLPDAIVGETAAATLIADATRSVARVADLPAPPFAEA